MGVTRTGNLLMKKASEKEAGPRGTPARGKCAGHLGMRPPITPSHPPNKWPGRTALLGTRL